MDKADIILDRIDTLEVHFKEHIEMCRMLCTSKIKAVDIKADKAHGRLDEHKQSLRCLFRYKNRQIGALIGIGIVLTFLGYKVL